MELRQNDKSAQPEYQNCLTAAKNTKEECLSFLQSVLGVSALKVEPN